MGKDFERRKLAKAKSSENGNVEAGDGQGVDFIKLHVPPKTLMKYAEILKMRMPLRVTKLKTSEK